MIKGFLKRGIPILLFTLSFILFAHPTFADQKLLGIEIKNAETSISLNWDDIGTSYKVYQDQKLLWEGGETSFTQKNLENDMQYNYKVEALNKDGEVIEYSKVRAKTKKNKTVINNYLSEDPDKIDKSNFYNISVNSAQDDDSVIINWDGTIPDDDEVFEVYRNGKHIDETTGKSFTDRNIEEDQEYVYEIEGKKKLSDKEIQKIRAEIEDHGDKITKEDEKELFYNTYNLTRTISTRKELSTYAAAQKYIIRYTTFIPMKYADNPAYGKVPKVKTKYFNGNNRKFDPFSNTYKTRMDVTIDFPASGNAKATLSKSNKKVEKTTFYDKNKKKIGSKKASSSGMNISGAKGTKNKVSYNAYHNIGIPYLEGITPGITYDYNATVYRDGGYTITGSHDRAPSHEMYIMIPNSDTYNTIHRRKHVGFKYLAPPFPNYVINESY